GLRGDRRRARVLGSGRARAGPRSEAQGARAPRRSVGAMNAPGPDRSCPHTDDVVARHLDGDVSTATATWRGAEELADHLRDCAACQGALQRSRRLDAALAEAGGRATIDLEHDDGRWSRLLARAVAAATAPPPAAPPPAETTTTTRAPLRRLRWRLVT